mmetsp:Transcript_17830/g.26562  ORF Transcript_17830/g.26562 Transcript_17830/m.26562 type:complete len:395 (+) Transcript_17830:117-1301(+)
MLRVTNRIGKTAIQSRCSPFVSFRNSAHRCIHDKSKLLRKCPRTSTNLLRCTPSITQGNVQGRGQLGSIKLRHFSAAAADAAEKKAKTPGDVFLDNLGTIFLSGIGLIIVTLIRSSRGTSNKNKLRAHVESTAALDPFEIDDLRTANDQFTPQVFRDIQKALKHKHGWTLDQKIDYKLFVSAVMLEMKEMKGEAFTIQFGHLLDRVIISALEKIHQEEVQYAENEEEKEWLDVRFLLVALSLALSGSVRERVEALYSILIDDDDEDQDKVESGGFQGQVEAAIVDYQRKYDSTHGRVIEEKDVVQMVGFLQKTCQLVPDAQIIESDTKYPAQEYIVGSPDQLTFHGKELKKEELSQDALEGGERGWSCDDFHLLLRSKSICAWGECYVKRKGLT